MSRVKQVRLSMSATKAALRRHLPSPWMAIAITALVVTAGGVSIAATGGLIGPQGQITACVARQDLLEPVVDLVAPVTKTVVKAGTMRVVESGEECRPGETPLEFNQTGPESSSGATDDGLPKVFATQNRTMTAVDDDMTGLAAKTLPAGSFVAQGSVQLEAPKNLAVAQVLECSFVDPTGKVIAASTRTVTFAAKQPAVQSQNVPLNTLVSDMPAGKLKVACEDKSPSAPAASARAATSDSGSTKANAQYTAQPAESAKPPPADLHGCPTGHFCVWHGPHFDENSRFVRADKGRGQCYDVDTGGGWRSIVNNTDKTLGVFETTQGLTKWSNSGGAGPGTCDSSVGKTRGTHELKPLRRVEPGKTAEDIHYRNTQYNQDLGFYVVGLGAMYG